MHVRPTQAALRRLGLPARSQDYLRDLLQQYDRDGDGRIDWAEFHAYVARKERVVQRTFAKLDADGSGEISADELVPFCCFPATCRRPTHAASMHGTCGCQRPRCTAVPRMQQPAQHMIVGRPDAWLCRRGRCAPCG